MLYNDFQLVGHFHKCSSRGDIYISM